MNSNRQQPFYPPYYQGFPYTNVPVDSNEYLQQRITLLEDRIDRQSRQIVRLSRRLRALERELGFSVQ